MLQTKAICNLAQTKTKILYHPLKCLKKTNKLPAIWGKKNVSIHRIDLKKN